MNGYDVVSDLSDGQYYWPYMPELRHHLLDEKLAQRSADSKKGWQDKDLSPIPLTPEELESIRKKFMLVRLSHNPEDKGANFFQWKKLEVHYSFFPDLVEAFESTTKRLKNVIGDSYCPKNEMLLELALSENFGYDSDDCWNAYDMATRLEVINRQLFPESKRLFYVCPICCLRTGIFNNEPDPVNRIDSAYHRQIHSVATPDQVAQFKQLILSEYEKECAALDGRKPMQAFVDAVNNF